MAREHTNQHHAFPSIETRRLPNLRRSFALTRTSLNTYILTLFLQVLPSICPWPGWTTALFSPPCTGLPFLPAWHATFHWWLHVFEHILWRFLKTIRRCGGRANVRKKKKRRRNKIKERTGWWEKNVVRSRSQRDKESIMEPTTKHAHSLMILSKSSTSTVSSMVIDLFFTEKSWKCNSFELLLLADNTHTGTHSPNCK